jgi:hypothetical protein
MKIALNPYELCINSVNCINATQNMHKICIKVALNTHIFYQNILFVLKPIHNVPIRYLTCQNTHKHRVGSPTSPALPCELCDSKLWTSKCQSLKSIAGCSAAIVGTDRQRRLRRCAGRSPIPKPRGIYPCAGRCRLCNGWQRWVEATLSWGDAAESRLTSMLSEAVSTLRSHSLIVSFSHKNEKKWNFTDLVLPIVSRVHKIHKNH